MKRLSCLALALLLIGFSAARGASVYTETFDTSTAGWQDRDPGELILTNEATTGNPGGCLRGTFALAGGIPPPESDAFQATGQLSSANFIGDYSSAGVSLLGFDFRATNVAPSSLELRLTSVGPGYTSLVFRSFPSTNLSINTWYSYAVSLKDTASGQWLGNTNAFHTILTNVSRVEITVQRFGSGAQNYLIDNVYLAALPEASAHAVETDSVQVVWSNLRADETYRADAAGALDGTWTTLSAFTATSSVHTVVDTNASTHQVYRLVIE